MDPEIRCVTFPIASHCQSLACNEDLLALSVSLEPASWSRHRSWRGTCHMSPLCFRWMHTIK